LKLKKLNKIKSSKKSKKKLNLKMMIISIIFKLIHNLLVKSKKRWVNTRILEKKLDMYPQKRKIITRQWLKKYKNNRNKILLRGRAKK